MTKAQRGDEDEKRSFKKHAKKKKSTTKSKTHKKHKRLSNITGSPFNAIVLPPSTVDTSAPPETADVALPVPFTSPRSMQTIAVTVPLAPNIIPVALSSQAGVIHQQTLSSWSWGAVFAAAKAVPQEELDPEFLRRTTLQLDHDDNKNDDSSTGSSHNDGVARVSLLALEQQTAARFVTKSVTEISDCRSSVDVDVISSFVEANTITSNTDPDGSNKQQKKSKKEKKNKKKSKKRKRDGEEAEPKPKPMLDIQTMHGPSYPDDQTSASAVTGKISLHTSNTISQGTSTSSSSVAFFFSCRTIPLQMEMLHISKPMFLPLSAMACIRSNIMQ